jgi:hypothetical protein
MRASSQVDDHIVTLLQRVKGLEGFAPLSGGGLHGIGFYGSTFLAIVMEEEEAEYESASAAQPRWGPHQNRECGREDTWHILAFCRL